MIPLMQAFTVMLGDVTAADCSARQVLGIEQWQDFVLRALTAAQACDPPGQAGMSVASATSSTHRTWRDSAHQIIAALQAQIGEAEVRIAETRANIQKLEDQAREHERAAAAAEAAAAAHRAAAAAASANAAAAESQEQGSGAGFAAQAAQETAAAAAADAAAAAHRRAAQECWEEAGKERTRLALLIAWLAAATDAHGAGVFLVGREDAIAIPVGEAIQAAGGITEVALDKRYFSPS